MNELKETPIKYEANALKHYVIDEDSNEKIIDEDTFEYGRSSKPLNFPKIAWDPNSIKPVLPVILNSQDLNSRNNLKILHSKVNRRQLEALDRMLHSHYWSSKC